MFSKLRSAQAKTARKTDPENGLDIIEGDDHDLLEPPAPAYSNVTVRRAFIVWMYSGQTNKFKTVCNFYHHLEAFENTLPPNQRAASRHHELAMFTNPPQISPYVRRHFPKLYSDSPIDPYYIMKLEAIKNEKIVFKLEGFSDLQQIGVSTKEIFEASKMIRKYCQTQLISLRRFLEQFKDYANRCDLKGTVTNISMYIKRKMIQAELKTLVNYPKNFSFLNSTIESNVATEEYAAVGTSTPINVSTVNALDVETEQLKQLLGVQSATQSPKKMSAKDKNEKRYNSCMEFFKSFNTTNNKEGNSNSRTPFMAKTGNYNRVLDQDRAKSKSVESLYQGKENNADAMNF